MVQQVELAWPRPIVDNWEILDANWDRAWGGRVQVISTYQYLHPYDKDKDMGYIKTAEIGSIIPPTLPPTIKFNITSE